MLEAFLRNIYYGDRGICVKYIQLALTRAGYPAMLDGIFGEQTCVMLQQFLENMGSGNNDSMENADAAQEIWAEAGQCRVTEAVWNRLIPYLKGYSLNEENEVVVYDFPVVSEQVPYTSLLNDYVIEGLTARYPFLQIGTIGTSVMGKKIPWISIGTGSTQVFYSASYHANESITTPVLLRFLEVYAAAYAAGGMVGDVSASWLFENFKLYLVPMVNPDGVDLVNGFLKNGRYYRQAQKIAAAYPQIPFPDGWKANIDGVDLNLQFPAGWERAKQIKYAQGYVAPAPRDFVGTAPLTASESAAIYRFTIEHDFSLILAYHTQGEVIYWKYLNYEPERSYEIAQYFGFVSGYTVEETPQESGYAGYKDWFIQTYNRPGYTIEAGLGENPLPMIQFPEIYDVNFGILLGAMTQLMG